MSGIIPLLVNKELFHQSSFYSININSSVQLLFKQRYLHFSRGEKVRGRSVRGSNALDPTQLLQTLTLLPAPEQRAFLLQASYKTFLFGRSWTESASK